MRLSQYFSKESLLHDGEFAALGLSNSAPGVPFLSFLEDGRYAEELNANPDIRAVICKREMVPLLAPHIVGIAFSEAPRMAYFTLHNQLAQTPAYRGAQAESTMGPGCQVSPLACIAPYGVELGEGVVIEEFVTVKGPCRIGSGTVIRAGAKIGGEGFEFKLLEDSVLDVAHCGSVEIGSGVIIWENATIHKAVYPWDVTRVETGARVGANSHIDHGAKIGAYAKIGAGAVVSGRTEVGSRAYIGPGAVLSNRLHVGAGAHAALGSVVTRDIPAGQTVSGNFAIDHQKHIELLKKIR